MKGFRRTLGICVCLGALAACDSATDDGRTAFGPKPLFDPFPLPTNATGSPILPLPIDLLFGQEPGQDDNPANDADGTLAPAGSLAALPGWGLVDGWSTSAALFLNLQGPVDVENAANGIRIFDSRSPRELVPGEDFRVSRSPVSALSPRLVVHWLKPLNESSRYLVALTRDLRSPDGAPALVNELFAVLRNPTPFAEQTDVDSVTLRAGLMQLGRGDLIPQIEVLRSSFMQPVLSGIEQLSAALAQAPNARPALSRDDMVLAWSFTTQSISPTLDGINDSAEAQFLQLTPSGLSLAQVVPPGTPAEPLPLPPALDPEIQVGALRLPYYHAPGAENILSSIWENNGVIADGVMHPALNAPCAALLRPQSTTLCYPDPQVQADVTVPVLAARPRGDMPDGGWPVVIFLHGITQDRSNMLAIASALSAAGFVTIAIDQPLHGLPPGHPLRVPGTTERTFDADLDGDGEVDPSGTHFVNLTSTATARDNIRQSVADQIHLLRSLGNVRLGAAQDEPINTDRIHFVGHSLGGIVGTTLLGANAEIKAATVAMPGGGIGKLLDASATFGPVVQAGLEAAGVVKGTDTYEIFLRFAQLTIDSADPINWAARATADRPVHLIEVLGDSVVPNNAVDAEGLIIPGFLSGTQPLGRTMGLTPVAVSPPVDPPRVLSGSQWVQFDQGNHGSILSPTTADPNADPVFVEMQRQVANFLASNGVCLPLGSDCPQP
ncbi:MAG: alpha/beta fold hydrolase [Oceanococcaceae bacterium]